VENGEDDALVAAARAGDASAFGILLERHQSRVFRVLRLLGVADGDREDVAQEVFVRVFRHLGGYRRGRSFTGWLFRIAVNAAHDHRRRDHRRRRDEVDWGEGPPEMAAGAPGPGEVLDTVDLRNRLERAVRFLSERERTVFVLCELEEQSSREVARALGITTITVRRHLGRARRRLQQILSSGRKKD
jgi:RNA polymerase sigma-70 factor (ECF subfamily)